MLRPEVLTEFAGVDHILHAGDIGGDLVIPSLREIAPVTFVRGNNDHADGYDVVRVTIGAMRILLTHILPRPGQLAPGVGKSLRESPADIVVFGHSHLPHNELIDGVRYFNPASAGPRRFDLPVSVGMIEDGRAYHVALDERSRTALWKRMNQL